MRPQAHRWIETAIVAIVLGTVVRPAASKTTTLVLAAEARIEGNVVHLRDVVERCDDRGLGALRLFPSPRWGETRTVTRAEVEKRIWNATTARVKLVGSDAVEITRPGGDRGREIFSKVDETMASAVAHATGVTYELSSPVGPVYLPWGPMKVACVMPDTFNGSRVVRCVVRIGGEQVKNMSFVCRFTNRMRVPVATRRISRDDTLRAGDVAWEERTFSNHVPDLISPEVLAGGYHARRIVREGELVTAAAVERHPAVRAGQIVQLVIRRSVVQVTTRARALQTGWVGSRIRLQNPLDKSTVYGRVTGEGVVLYE